MGWKAAQKVFKHWRVLRGDNVMIMGGKDKGLTGKVQQVLRSRNMVYIEGRNLVKKHIKRSGENPGGIVTMESPLHISKLRHIDPVTNAPCRVVFRFLEDGSKVRVTTGGTASSSVIPRPDILKQRRTLFPVKPGTKDTLKEDVLERTFDPTSGSESLDKKQKFFISMSDTLCYARQFNTPICGLEGSHCGLAWVG
ncbi:hypothetical protein R1sor_027291 [Riccia sorocarpa]|uniref:KOW domain-containing protein n=1 Tax=Riccia sorocarpa TaxID=122646 RepID=A0ABD3GDU6_9MARC